MKKLLLIIKDIFFWFVALYDILWLVVFHVFYILLKLDYGKPPDDNIAITKSKYYYWIKEMKELNSNDVISLITVIFLITIVLKIFKINLISKMQIIVFGIGILLLFILMGIDPLGAFKYWYYD